MMGAVPVTVSSRQRRILENWVRSKAKTSHRLVERAQFVLMSADEVPNIEQARRLNVDRQRVRRWRRRWAAGQDHLAQAEQEGASDKDLTKLVIDLLDDNERSGTPPKFSAEQLAQIIAVACEQPEKSERPVTHWTPRELADEVIVRGIVDSISPRHVDRVLKGGICGHTRRNTG